VERYQRRFKSGFVSGAQIVSALIDRFRRTGRCPSLTEKIEDETDIAVLNGMQAACGARGQELTMEEIEAFARRRVELRKGRHNGA